MLVFHSSQNKFSLDPIRALPGFSLLSRANLISRPTSYAAAPRGFKIAWRK
jgi:hypothetical protein